MMVEWPASMLEKSSDMRGPRIGKIELKFSLGRDGGYDLNLRMTFVIRSACVHTSFSIYRKLHGMLCLP